MQAIAMGGVSTFGLGVYVGWQVTSYTGDVFRFNINLKTLYIS